MTSQEEIFKTREYFDREMRNRNNNIAQQLTVLAAKKYTGILRVQSSNSQEWIIYFRLGRLVWIDGAYYANRSWQRYLSKYCPQVDITEIINSSVFSQVEYCKYQCLAILFERKRIDRTQIKAIIGSTIVENLFQIVQQENNSDLFYILETGSNSRVLSSVLKIAFTLVDSNKAIKITRDKWKIWQGKGFENLQPNLAPKIKNEGQLKQQVSDRVYRNFVQYIDGNNTFQDLALQTNSDTVKVVSSLIDYIRQGSLELVTVEDRSLEAEKVFKTGKKLNQKSINKRLIVTIDDSKAVGYIMKEIIDRSGHESVNIDRPLQAIPTLIGLKPDLIFLDLAMPIVNGYEICSQIRRVSIFKNIPIIILTSNKGLIAKAKSKAVGATEFLSKPIAEKVILKTIDKYLNSAPLAA